MNVKQAVSTEKAPAAIGPYNQAITFGEFVFTSGQIALDPETQTMRNSTLAEETEQVFANLKAVLLAAGSDLSKVVKVTVFLSDMEYFAQVNGIYEQHFTGVLPARSAVQVARLPKDARVEIEALAHL